MNYFFSLIFLLAYSLSALAQNARNAVEAQHFIKLGNTLRMVDRSEQAIDLLLRLCPPLSRKTRIWKRLPMKI